MKNLKLNKLAQNRLNEKEINSIKGGTWYTGLNGYTCGCACAYANSSGSTTAGNGWANNEKKLCSPGLCY
jgi:natural product precursor